MIRDPARSYPDYTILLGDLGNHFHPPAGGWMNVRNTPKTRSIPHGGATTPVSRIHSCPTTHNPEFLASSPSGPSFRVVRLAQSTPILAFDTRPITLRWVVFGQVRSQRLGTRKGPIFHGLHGDQQTNSRKSRFAPHNPPPWPTSTHIPPGVSSKTTLTNWVTGTRSRDEDPAAVSVTHVSSPRWHPNGPPVHPRPRLPSPRVVRSKYRRRFSVLWS